jgi:hypothetical protein
MASISVPDQPPVLIYAAAFTKHDDGTRFAFGGSGTNKVFVYDSRTFEKVSETEELGKPVFALDFCDSHEKMAVALGDGSLITYGM